jgi:predicted nucleic acid-binding protein
MLPDRIVLDANILYSETLTDVFLALAASHLVAVIWSNRLCDEWERALARNRPEIEPHWVASRRRRLESAQNWMLLTIDDAVVEQLVLPDRNDRHVLALAIQADASTIVTANLRDFPRRTLAVHGVQVVTADAVVRGLMDRHGDRAIAALQPPGGDTETHREHMRRAGLARSVKGLRARLETPVPRAPMSAS